MAAARLLWRFVFVLSLVMAPLGALNAQQTMQLADSGDAQDLYAQAESLLADGRTRNAYELLRAYESEFAGNPYFDYLLGVAALDSGRNSEAILSLRRAAIGAPQFSAARMELARALYDAGEYAEARPMFVTLRGENPPALVREIIDGYVNAIDKRPSAPPARFVPYAELMTGHDSNANGATGDSEFLGFMLSPENQKTDSVFVEGAAGFDWYLPKSTHFGWFIGARAGYRDNNDAPFVNSGVISGIGNMNWRRGAVFGQLGLAAYAADRDGESNESYVGVDLLFGRTINEEWDLSFALRSGGLRYDDSIEVLDVDRTLYTITTSRRFASRGKISLAAIGGGDNETQVGSPYGNSKYGARFGITAPLSESSYLIASVGSLASDFDGQFFGGARFDRQLYSLLQIEFRDVFTNGLTLAPRVRFTDNDSNVDLYAYNRTEVGLLIRWAPQ